MMTNDDHEPGKRTTLEPGYLISVEATCNDCHDHDSRLRRLERVIGFFLGSTLGPLFEGPAALIRLHDRVSGLTVVWSAMPTAAQRAAINNAWKLFAPSCRVRTLHKIEYGNYV